MAGSVPLGSGSVTGSTWCQVAVLRAGNRRAPSSGKIMRKRWVRWHYGGKAGWRGGSVTKPGRFLRPVWHTLCATARASYSREFVAQLQRVWASGWRRG